MHKYVLGREKAIIAAAMRQEKERQEQQQQVIAAQAEELWETLRMEDWMQMDPATKEVLECLGYDDRMWATVKGNAQSIGATTVVHFHRLSL